MRTKNFIFNYKTNNDPNKSSSALVSLIVLRSLKILL